MSQKTLLSRWIKQPPGNSVQTNVPNSETNSSANVGWNSIFKPKERFMVKLKYQQKRRAYKIQRMKCNEAPFNTVHISSNDHNNLKSNLSRDTRKFKYRRKTTQHLTDVKTINQNLKIEPPQFGTRELMTFNEISGILKSRGIESAVGKNNYDLGLFESQMWTKKYTPSYTSHLNQLQTNQLKQWIGDKLSGSGNGAGTGTFNGIDSTVMILRGPPGSGKTSAVYSACAALDTFVFEVNTSTLRNSRNLTALLEGIAHNHSVHTAKNVLVLIDEVDLVFEKEASSFFMFLSKFVKTSKRPVCLTCESLNFLECVDFVYCLLNFSLGTPELVTKAAFEISLHEGHLLDYDSLLKVVKSCNCDLRRVLVHLQFWCQMGVDDISGQLWTPKQHEMENDVRVISRNTFIGTNSIGSSHDCSVDTDMTIDVGMDTDTLSLMDTQLRTILTNTDDTIYIPNQLVLPEFYEDTKNDVSNVKINQLETEINPYLRFMAAQDYVRELKVNQMIQQSPHSSQRLLRRAWAAAGVDVRQHLNLSVDGLKLLLSRGFQSRYYM